MWVLDFDLIYDLYGHKPTHTEELEFCTVCGYYHAHNECENNSKCEELLIENQSVEQ